jgi:hypothetical protein
MFESGWWRDWVRLGGEWVEKLGRFKASRTK